MGPPHASFDQPRPRVVFGCHRFFLSCFCVSGAYPHRVLRQVFRSLHCEKPSVYLCGMYRCNILTPPFTASFHFFSFLAQSASGFIDTQWLRSSDTGSSPAVQHVLGSPATASQISLFVTPPLPDVSCVFRALTEKAIWDRRVAVLMLPRRNLAQKSAYSEHWGREKTSRQTLAGIVSYRGVCSTP